jgi:CDP-diacylglycerol--serine O-phosphatidyltransferase
MKRTDIKKSHSGRLKRGVYLLPNLFTAMNMFCGFYAMIAAINGKFVPAAYAIIIAGIFDNLDGKIARVTRTTSQFGIEFDSLADLVSFGVAPGLIIYQWALSPLGRIGWLAAFLFVVCGALRLARFNTQVGTVSSDHFMGLPIPAAAGMSVSTVLFCHHTGIEELVHPFVFLAMLYILAFLMVSTVRYASFKKAELFRNKSFNVLVTAILIIVFIAAQPPIALFLIGITYVLSGPLMSLRHHRPTKELVDDPSKEEDQRSSPV